MTARLSGKRAIVTGSTSGIGEGIARVFASEGASVAIVGRSSDAGEKIAASIRNDGGEAIYIACDVSKADDVKSMVEAAVDRFDGLDTLVCSAGIGVYCPSSGFSGLQSV